MFAYVVRPCSLIRISIVSCRAEVFLQTIHDGFLHNQAFSCPCVFSATCSELSSLPACSRSRKNQLQFFGPCLQLSNAKAFNDFLRTLFREEWVVYAKQPFGGPEHVLHYLARYTHRVAISNHRLLNLTEHDVTFRWKDYAHRSKLRAMTLTPEEFLRRFLQHVLPTGFPRIRYSAFSRIAIAACSCRYAGYCYMPLLP